MRVAVVSDSHGDLYMLQRVIESIFDLDAIIHLGDHYEDIITLNEKYHKDIFYVAGNNDYDMSDPLLREKTIVLDDVKIFLTHGDRYYVHRGIDNIYYRAKEIGASLVLFGHTHRQFYEKSDEIVFLNPGSVSYPRDIGPGFAILDIKNGEFNITLKRVEGKI